MIGTRLAHYQVESHLGSGGMGDVYQALDSRLGRKVALKLLPDAFVRDPERLARFGREARVLASLNHPHIASLHGLEQADGRPFLVMELVEGETLADRIARGPVPVEEALRIAHQMTEALEAAHAKTVVHRDLKPANVKITPDGKVKILDFGLARAFDPASSDPSNLQTLTSPALMTHQGVILGTAAYMSPEQAKGREVDQRADIFAFGCVLFEMLTGQRSFPGDTVSESIASVLAREADLTLLPANIHPRLHELLRRCFEKDPARRWQAIGDVRVEIETIQLDPHGLKVAAVRGQPTPWWRWAAVVAATAVLATAATWAVMRALQPPMVAPDPVRFSFALPKDQSFTRTGRHVLAVSPDGASVVYVANFQLYLKRMSDMEARPVAGTNQDVNSPFFSPDGRWIGFCAVPENKLKRVLVDGGVAVTLADIENPNGADWYADDAILVGQGPKGIVRLSASGGKPETVITVKPGEIAQSPHMLPDGRTVLFTLVDAAGQEWDKAKIVVQALTSAERTVLIDGGRDARYVSTGHILYALGGIIYAIPFDARALKVTGGPVPVVTGVSGASCCTAASFFDVARNGSFVSIPGSVTDQSPRILGLARRNGETTMFGFPAAAYYDPAFSPDGERFAVSIYDGRERNIWLYDRSARSAPRRLTFGASLNVSPLWTPDGRRLVFQSLHEAGRALWWQAADGSGSAERLTAASQDGTFVIPGSWSPDGRVLTFSMSNAIWALYLDGDRKPVRIIAAPKGGAYNPRFSPDGRWIAYESDESSKKEIYVQPFPPTGAKYLISTSGAIRPRWSPDGKQLLYLSQAVSTTNLWDRLTVVDVRTQPSFSFGTAVSLPITGFVDIEYDISPDGRHFLMTFPAPETKSADKAPLQINVVLNWFTELKQKAGASGQK